MKLFIAQYYLAHINICTVLGPNYTLPWYYTADAPVLGGGEVCAPANDDSQPARDMSNLWMHSSMLDNRTGKQQNRHG